MCHKVQKVGCSPRSFVRKKSETSSSHVVEDSTGNNDSMWTSAKRLGDLCSCQELNPELLRSHKEFFIKAKRFSYGKAVMENYYIEFVCGLQVGISTNLETAGRLIWSYRFFPHMEGQPLEQGRAKGLKFSSDCLMLVFLFIRAFVFLMMSWTIFCKPPDYVWVWNFCNQTENMPKFT